MTAQPCLAVPAVELIIASSSVEALPVAGTGVPKGPCLPPCRPSSSEHVAGLIGTGCVETQPPRPLMLRKPRQWRHFLYKLGFGKQLRSAKHRENSRRLWGVLLPSLGSLHPGPVPASQEGQEWLLIGRVCAFAEKSTEVSVREMASLSGSCALTHFLNDRPLRVGR